MTSSNRSRRAMLLAAASVLGPIASISLAQSLVAFPGADGAGAYATGGRGGSVYRVTKVDANSSDNSPGTLRYGLSLPGPKTIVFDVSGHFFLGRSVSGWDPNGNGWDTTSRLNIPSNVTIAGQTAPGPVVLHGGLVKLGGSNVILRNVTIAPGYGSRTFSEPTKTPTPGDFPDSYVYDALDITGQNVIIDHVTTVYATDETISMNEMANHLTIQYSNISQGQNYPQADAEASGVRYTGHALGSIVAAGSNAKISLHHNLYAHQKGRLPRVGTEADKLTVPGVGAYNDFRNNVFYNWLGTAGSGASGQASQNNFVSNFYLAGDGGQDPVGGTSTAIRDVAGGTGIFSGNDATLTRVFHSGNLKDLNKDADALDTVALANADFGSSAIQATAYTQVPYLGVTDTAADAYARVLDHVGATWWNRSSLDQRIIDEVRTGTGRILAWADDPFDASPTEGVEWRALTSLPTVARPAGFDNDTDGMPDEWERRHALDPAVADHNGDFDTDGYTNLEEYLNDLAAWPASRPLVFTASTSQRYAVQSNWDIPWQPSRFDVAQLRSGTMLIDAVGQHARRLEVASVAGQSATLKVQAGWIDIAERLVVGAAGSGSVEQTGGTVVAQQAVVLGNAAAASGSYTLAGGLLTTPQLIKGPGGGSFRLTGGTLSAGVVGFDLVNEGGTLAPGNSIGHTHVAGSLALLAGALQIELKDRASDTLAVTGLVTLGGDLHVALLDGFVPRDGDFWTILVAPAGITGSFASVPDGYRVQIEGDALRLYHAPIPEPRAALLGLGIALLALRR
jgi:pectate lyase